LFGGKMKIREVIKRIKKLGWEFSRHGTNHDIWKRGIYILTVPRHSMLNPRIARKILADAKRGGKSKQIELGRKLCLEVMH